MPRHHLPEAIATVRFSELLWCMWCENLWCVYNENAEGRHLNIDLLIDDLNRDRRPQSWRSELVVCRAPLLTSAREIIEGARLIKHRKRIVSRWSRSQCRRIGRYAELSRSLIRAWDSSNSTMVPWTR